MMIMITKTSYSGKTMRWTKNKNNESKKVCYIKSHEKNRISYRNRNSCKNGLRSSKLALYDELYLNN